MQTGSLLYAAAGMLQHDKQATSHCLWQLGYSAFRIRTPHSFPEQTSTSRLPRPEYTDGRPWIERLGNAECECGMRNVVCR